MGCLFIFMGELRKAEFDEKSVKRFD